MPAQHNSNVQSKITDQQPTKGLGTFAGVFTPSILTILGLILFLRLGYVTGSGGVGRALAIIAVANIITILTSQSLAAIATNIKVKGGGDYYLISRTLGVEFGGAIGIVLYLAQSVSVAFYCIGFAEAVSALLGPETFLSARLIAILAVTAIFLLAWMGADIATRFQYVVMALLIAALGSFFLGGIPRWESTQFLANWSPTGEPLPFWVVFGIFFPAVTGFTQGVSMSGDLEDPGKSLPLGTFLAVGLSIMVYLAIVITFAGVLPNTTLTKNFQAINQISRYGFLIDAGVIAATLSSAMASFLGGPRIFQSLAADRIFPLLTPFAKGAGPTNNPRRAILLTGLIALVVILFGQLDLVARIVSMFFLISYGLLNYATWYEAHSESPSFRPRFRWFNKYLSLLGCLVCLGVIIALDLEYGLIALAILAAIYFYIHQKKEPARWADSNRSHAMQTIRKQLFAASDEPAHARDWRPHILAFTKDSERRPLLLHFANWIGGSTGLISCVKILEGHEPQVTKTKKTDLAELTSSIQKEGLKIFPLVISGRNITESLETLLQSYGVGPLKGNTFLCNWYGETLSSFPGLTSMKFGHNLRLAFRCGYNIVVFHGDPLRVETLFDTDKKDRTIDVWWNDDASSRLMLLFAHLVTRDDLWKKTTIRVLTVGETADLKESIDHVEQQLDDARIEAEVVIIPDTSPETITRESAGSDLVFLPFRIKHSMLTDTNGFSLERVLTRLPPVALVMARSDIDLDAEPEEGTAGRLAQAMDNLHDREKRFIRAKKQWENLVGISDALKKRYESKSVSLDESVKNDIKQQLNRAEMESEKSFRRKAKEKAKLDDAVASIKQLGQ